MSLVTRQTMVDDSGTFTDGTVVTEAFVDQIYDQIEDQTHSTTNTTIKPKAITDEVVTARGSKASLDARLDVALNDDGTLKTQASLISQTDAASFIGKRSIAKNDEFATWPSGGAAAPGDYVLSGTGAAVARCGSGESDTTTLDAGTYCAKLTYGSASAKLTQAVLAAADVTKWGRVKSKKVFVGIRCKASVSSQASLVVDDGVTTTRGGQGGAGTYHTGGGSAEWLYCVHTISASATKLDVYLETASSGAAYFGGLVVVFSDVALLDWSPSMASDGKLYPEVILAGYSGTQGYGAFRTTNNAKVTLSIPAGTLAVNGDSLEIFAHGAQNAAAFFGMGIAVGATPTDYSLASANSSSGPARLIATITRISSTSVAVIMSVWTNDNALTASINSGTTAAAPLTVSDLASNALSVVIGMGSSAGAGTDSTLMGYKVLKIGAKS